MIKKNPLGKTAIFEMVEFKMIVGFLVKGGNYVGWVMQYLIHCSYLNSIFIISHDKTQYFQQHPLFELSNTTTKIVKGDYSKTKIDLLFLHELPTQS